MTHSPKIDFIAMSILFFLFSYCALTDDQLSENHALTPDMLINKIQNESMALSKKLDYLAVFKDDQLEFLPEQQEKIKAFLFSVLTNKDVSLADKLKCLEYCHSLGVVPEPSDEIIKNKTLFKQEPELLYHYLFDYLGHGYTSEFYNNLRACVEKGNLSQENKWVVICFLEIPPYTSDLQNDDKRLSYKNLNKYCKLVANDYFVNLSNEMLVKVSYYDSKYGDYWAAVFSALLEKDNILLRKLALMHLNAISDSKDISDIKFYLVGTSKSPEECFLTSKEIPIFEKMKSQYPVLSSECDNVINRIKEQEKNKNWIELTQGGSFTKKRP